MLLGVYNYTVLLTYFGMLMAYTGITQALHGNLHNALICLMLSGLCDMFDGKVASTKRDRTLEERLFGIQIDSLSDLICFGTLPAVLVYRISDGSSLSFYISGFYLLCALVRLAWFNVDEEQRQSKEDRGRSIYYGLPVTTSALIIPAVVVFGRRWNWQLSLIAPVTLLVMGIAFVTPFQLEKPKLPGKIGMILCGCAELLLLIWGMDV